MRKKTKIILTLGCASLCCLALGACKLETDLDKLDKKGCDVTVTYDPNGGSFMTSPDVTIVCKFNSDRFTDGDGDGKIEIPLKGTDPAVSKYTSVTGKQLIGVPAKTGFSFAGWYKTREPMVNENNEPLDAYGNVLEARGGISYIKGTDTASEQAYHYSEKWDFAEDKIVYEIGSEPYSLTLYAAWVPYYKFNFYYEKDGEWTQLGESQTFDYMTTQRFNDSDYGYEHAVKNPVNNDYIWVPQWSGKDENGAPNNTGEMNHEHKRSNDSIFTFPSLKAHTFKAAYTDKECTQEITSELMHAGTLTYDKTSKKLIPEGITQDIYVKFDEGVQYRIGSAKDFVTYGAKADENSIYTIVASELDFTDKDGKPIIWPAALTSMEFAGKIIGNNSTFKNITARNGDSSVAYGGLFGTITAEAVVKDITFENVTYDMATGTTRGGKAYYGVFAGIIESGADISRITVINPTLQIGKLGRADYQANLICGNANGNSITYSGAQVVLTASKSGNKFLYFVKNVSVNEENGNVTFEVFVSSRDAEEKDTETYVAYSANNN